MEVIGWYVLFAVTTAFATIYELIYPVIQQLEVIKEDHNLIKYRFITYCIFLFTAFTLAPLFFLACIIPSVAERFRKSTLESFLAA